MQDSTIETLESLIDKHGLLHIVTGLELICFEKADHITCNWQDHSLAKRWYTTGLKIRDAANFISDLGI